MKGPCPQLRAPIGWPRKPCAVKDPQIAERLRSEGVEPVGNSPEEFAADPTPPFAASGQNAW